MEYAVFSRRILTGTVSDLSPAVRIAWITILFEAERLRGKVKLPVRDLAKMASITTPEAAEALSVFQAPDPYSSTKEHDGRRLLPIDGEEDWYVVTTWDKHAEERAAFFARLRQQRSRARHATSRSVTDSHAPSRSVTNEPEPEPEPEEKLEPKSKDSSAPPPSAPPQLTLGGVEVAAAKQPKKRSDAPKLSAKDAVESFELDAGRRAWAAQNCPSVPADEELSMWRDRMRANGYRTNQGPVKDAAASWRTSMRNAEEWGTYTKRGGGNGRAGHVAGRKPPITLAGND